MKIFDGVELKQAPGSNVQSWLSVALLVANSFLEAEKHRQERVAGTTAGGPGTLDDVMAQAGLKIPGIEQALAQLMGGSDEAKQAASMIVSAPDPGKLLQQFAKQFGFSGAANAGPTGPIVTPPPAQSEPSPVLDLPRFRPEFTREAREAARAAAAGSGEAELPKVRPDFTREAREAARVAAAGAREAELPKFRPEFTREARQAARTASASPNGTDPTAPSSSKPDPRATQPAPATPDAPAPASAVTQRPSLVSLVERQLAALRQRMKAHEEALDARLARAEAELAALRQEFEQRGKPALVVVAAEEDTEGREAGETAVDQPLAEEPEDRAVAENTENTEEAPLTLDVPELTLGLEAPLPAATEDEVVQAVGLISAFAEEYEERHQKGVARVIAVEHELQVMRSMVQPEAAASHG
jgi:hypothetical protein